MAILSALETFNGRRIHVKIVDSNEDPWGAWCGAASEDRVRAPVVERPQRCSALFRVKFGEVATVL